MSIANVLTQLAAKLATLSITYANGDVVTPRVFADPAEAINLGDFPVIVLGIAPEERHQWTRKAVGTGLHRYTVAIWVFVGARQTELPELHSRAIRWVEPISDLLLADQRVNNSAAYIGEGGAVGKLFDYIIYPAQEWADGVYFSLTFLLPVSENKLQQMN